MFIIIHIHARSSGHYSHKQLRRDWHDRETLFAKSKLSFRYTTLHDLSCLYLKTKRMEWTVGAMVQTYLVGHHVTSSVLPPPVCTIRRHMSMVKLIADRTVPVVTTFYGTVLNVLSGFVAIPGDDHATGRTVVCDTVPKWRVDHVSVQRGWCRDS